MQPYAARELNVRAEPRVDGLPKQTLRALQRVERFSRIAGSIGYGGEPAQCESFTSRISELVLQVVRFRVRLFREFPFLQGFVRATEVVEGDRDLALEPGLTLRLQRAGVDMNRLGIVTHAV